MNTNFEVIGLARLEMKSLSTAPEADALTIRPSEPSMAHWAPEHFDIAVNKSYILKI